MGYARPRPQRLAEKLKQVRQALGLSQTAFAKQLRVKEKVPYTRISDYERNKNEPSLMVLLEYARLAGVQLEIFADDQLDLPARLPSAAKHGNNTSRRKR